MSKINVPKFADLSMDAVSPYFKRSTQVASKNNALNRGCTLAPPGKYDGFIFATAVM